MIEFVDIVCGLAWGDEAKGKITSQLAATGEYDYVCRWAGGDNAGHTVYVRGDKFKTHLIPSGVFYGVESIIGPGCVLHIDSFFKELAYLANNGFDTSVVKVSPNTHIVLNEHIEEDTKRLHKKLGTTARGIAPCYSEKSRRTGVRAKDVPELRKRIWDGNLKGKVLCEGAQGFWLDLDWGNYPYVTSSTTLPYAACSLGFPPQKIRKIYGAAKIYDTRSGTDPDFPETLLEDYELAKVAQEGSEYGVTTGRKRKCNWLNLDLLIKAINVSGTTHVVISKIDVLQKLKYFRLFYKQRSFSFFSDEEMFNFINKQIIDNCELVKDIVFSSSPHSF